MPEYLSPGMHKIEFWNWETQQWEESRHWHFGDFPEHQQNQLIQCEHVKVGKMEFRLVQETIPPQRFELLKNL